MLAAEIVWPTVTATPLSRRVSPVASVRLLIVIDARAFDSASVNGKFDTAKARAVSSFVVTLLETATGTSFTAVTLIDMVPTTVPRPASFTLNVNRDRARPFALAAGV